MGFGVVLGILALMGIIIRNSVILVDQIASHVRAGESVREAIIDSTILRFRQIILTATAAATINYKYFLGTNGSGNEWKIICCNYINISGYKFRERI